MLTTVLVLACVTADPGKGDGVDSAAVGDSGCGASVAVVTGQVRWPWDGGAVEGGQVLARVEGESPFQASVDADGAYALQLNAGTWFLRAQDPVALCPTPESELALEACDEVVLDFFLDDCEEPD